MERVKRAERGVASSPQGPGIAPLPVCRVACAPEYTLQSVCITVP